MGIAHGQGHGLGFSLSAQPDHNWCKSRYEEQRVFIVFLFLFELGFIYSSTLN